MDRGVKCEGGRLIGRAVFLTTRFDVSHAAPIGILAAQRRAVALADLRAQITLEHSILTEQKAAKMIELLEELRRDHPEIANRSDRQARALSVPTDPKDVADAIVESHADIK